MARMILDHVSAFVVFALGSALLASCANAQYAYISNINTISSAPEVSVINTVTNTLAATVQLANDTTGENFPGGVAVNPAGAEVYVTVGGPTAGSVSMIDTATNSVSGSVNVGANPVGIAVNSSGTLVYVANYFGNTVSVIDAATSAITATVSAGSYPMGVAVNPSGTRVYVTNLFSNTVSVIDTTTNIVTATVSVGNNPGLIVVSPDGTRVYVGVANRVEVIDAATNTVGATVVLGSNPQGIAVNSAGTYVYVTSSQNTVLVIDTYTNSLASTLQVGTSPQAVALNPAGTRAYVTYYNSSLVDVIDTATNTVTATVNIGGNAGNFLGNFIGGPTIPASINSGGVVNSASFATNAPVAPGSIASVFGEFPVTAAESSGSPLPTILSNMTLQFNGIPARFFFTSSTQANIQIPWELAGQTSAFVTATVGDQTTPAQTVNLATFAPGVFTMNAQGQGAVVDALSGQVISPLNPAKAGGHLHFDLLHWPRPGDESTRNRYPCIRNRAFPHDSATHSDH
jgi:YVTN family beta-propeller protein